MTATCKSAIVNFLDESKRCLTFVKSVRHFRKCHANHVNRGRVFILADSCQHTFTRQIQVYQHGKVGEKVGENIEASFVCRQQFANVFADCFSAVHTHELKFAHTGLPTLVCRVEAA